MEKVINRPKYLERLTSLMNNGRVKIVTGARRSGKSYLLANLFREHLLSRGVPEDHFIFLSFEGNENRELRNPIELERYIKSLLKDDATYYLVIDEAQNIYSILDPLFTGEKIVPAKMDDPHAITYISVVLSLMKIKNLDIYVSGSNSRFLSKDIVTEFRDRGDEIHVLPLSFSEFASCLDSDKEALYEEYSLYGGMPLVLQYDTSSEKERYLKNLYELTYAKDIVERNKIKDGEAVDLLTGVLADSIGSLTNSKKLASTFLSKNKKITDDTVSSYLGFLQDAYLVDKVERYDIRGRKKIGALYKYYFTDVGIRNARTNFLSRDSGRIMENIIYNELIYRGFSVEIGVLNSYKKVNGATKREDYETDFLVKKGSVTYYIQSCYSINDEDTYERETRPFKLINDSFKKIIVKRTSGPIRHDEYGITEMGIIDFLLREDSLDL